MADRKSFPERFGDSEPLSIGVEEELLLVDDEDQLAPLAEEVVSRFSNPDNGISTEILR